MKKGINKKKKERSKIGGKNSQKVADTK